MQLIQTMKNPAGEADGYDITIKKEKTGPLPQNVKYSCLPARNNSPLTEEEKGLELLICQKSTSVKPMKSKKNGCYKTLLISQVMYLTNSNQQRMWMTWHEEVLIRYDFF